MLACILSRCLSWVWAFCPSQKQACAFCFCYTPIMAGQYPTGWAPQNQGGDKHGNGYEDQWSQQWRKGSAKQRGHDKFDGNADPQGQSAWKNQCSGFADHSSPLAQLRSCAGGSAGAADASPKQQAALKDVEPWNPRKHHHRINLESMAGKAPPPDHGNMQFQVKCDHGWENMDDESNEFLILYTGFFMAFFF